MCYCRIVGAIIRVGCAGVVTVMGVDVRVCGSECRWDTGIRLYVGVCGILVCACVWV